MLSLIPAACAALLCAASPDATLPAAALLPALETPAALAAGFCVPTSRAAGAAAPRRTGPLGWLMRYNRDEDELERTRIAAPISYYLRSPLMTSFFASVPCPQPAERAEAAGGEECATLLVRGREGDDLLEVPLPQHGATTAVRLRSMVSEHQARGEALNFVVHGYSEVEIPAGAIREVQAKACR